MTMEYHHDVNVGASVASTDNLNTKVVDHKLVTDRPTQSRMNETGREEREDQDSYSLTLPYADLDCESCSPD